jgi:hypothetical protein
MASFLAAMRNDPMRNDERAEFLPGIATQPGETDGTGVLPSTLDITGR